MRLTVAGNVQIGFHLATRGGVAATLLRLRWVREQERHVHEKAQEFLDFVVQGAQADMMADRLPYGQQRLLASRLNSPACYRRALQKELTGFSDEINCGRGY